MKNSISSSLCVLMIIGAVAGSPWLTLSLARDERWRDVIVALGYLSAGFLLILVCTGIGYLLVRRFDNTADIEASMPVLRPLPIHTSQRSCPGRVVVWLHDVRKWEVAENWEYTLPGGGPRIVIHSGFRFDGASIPRFLWAILSPTGLLLIQGLIHDYAYRYGQLWQVENSTVRPYNADASKADWDRLFRQTGRAVNGMSVINFAAWLAVYLLGYCAWRTNRRKSERPVIPWGMSRAED